MGLTNAGLVPAFEVEPPEPLLPAEVVKVLSEENAQLLARSHDHTR